MQHPTPAEIRNMISDALRDDQLKNQNGALGSPFPVRALRVINEAISKACDEATK